MVLEINEDLFLSLQPQPEEPLKVFVLPYLIRQPGQLTALTVIVADYGVPQNGKWEGFEITTSGVPENDKSEDSEIIRLVARYSVDSSGFLT
jgi:hypothetical protein